MKKESDDAIFTVYNQVVRRKSVKFSIIYPRIVISILRSEDNATWEPNYFRKNTFPEIIVFSVASAFLFCQFNRGKNVYG